MTPEQVAQITHNVAQGIRVLGTIARDESRIAPYAALIAGFLPGAGTVFAALAIAQPYIDKAAAAAPEIAAAVDAGTPVAQAMVAAGPDILQHVKAAVAIFHNVQPGAPVTGALPAALVGKQITPDDVPDDIAMAVFGKVLLGRTWTPAELNGWMDRASGQANF